MTIPCAKNIKVPILHELSAAGGTDEIRYLYERLIPYFPALSDADISEIKKSRNTSWRKAVQKAGKMLDEENLIIRVRGNWTLTEKGWKAIALETDGMLRNISRKETFSHQEIQKMLVEIGEILGFYGEAEFEFYDVIWRESLKSQRISHVFEVLSRGNLDSALAKLKRAFDAQRSKPFLVISSERDALRARNSLRREFLELENVITLLSFAEVRKIHENLTGISVYLPCFLEV